MITETATRKQIIDLIEPYMEKDLTIGCLFSYNNEFIQLGIAEYYNDNVDKGLSTWESIYSSCDKIGIYKEIYDRYGDSIRLNSYIVGETDGFKILGHYDITAVLKYIRNCFGNCCSSYDDDHIYYSGFRKDRFKIPNKPLHLYTEREEQNLLQILLELQK